MAPLGLCEGRVSPSCAGAFAHCAPLVTLLWRYLRSSVVKVTKACSLDKTVCLLGRLLFPWKEPRACHSSRLAVSCP